MKNTFNLIKIENKLRNTKMFETRNKKQWKIFSFLKSESVIFFFWTKTLYLLLYRLYIVKNILLIILNL